MVSDPVIGDQVITFLNVGEDVAESQRMMGPLSPYAQVVVFAFNFSISSKLWSSFCLLPQFLCVACRASPLGLGLLLTFDLRVSGV